MEKKEKNTPATSFGVVAMEPYGRINLGGARRRDASPDLKSLTASQGDLLHVVSLKLSLAILHLLIFQSDFALLSCSQA